MPTSVNEKGEKVYFGPKVELARMGVNLIGVLASTRLMSMGLADLIEHAPPPEGGYNSSSHYGISMFFALGGSTALYSFYKIFMRSMTEYNRTSQFEQQQGRKTLSEDYTRFY